MNTNIIKEFKEFVSRGNVFDLAVGVIVGGAFGKITTSLVEDVIMPVLGIILGKIDFTNLKFVIIPASENVPESAIKYGLFIQNVVNFIIVAFVIFLMVKFINNLKKVEKEEVKNIVPAPSKEEVLLSEIRDILKNK